MAQPTQERRRDTEARLAYGNAGFPGRRGPLTALLHWSGALAVAHEVVPARAQMATTLGFHIILACFGIAFPTIVLAAEYLGLRHSDEVAMILAKRWSLA